MCTATVSGVAGVSSYGFLVYHFVVVVSTCIDKKKDVPATYDIFLQEYGRVNGSLEFMIDG